MGHLRQMDLQRFNNENTAARAEATLRLKMQAELPESEQGPSTRDPSTHPSTRPSQQGSRRASTGDGSTPASPGSGSWKQASWGAPRLRNAPVGQQWAGNGMPSGKCQRSSNP